MLADSDFTAPGIVNHLVLRGDDKLTFEEAFALDRRYVRRRELFTDMFIVLKKIVLEKEPVIQFYYYKRNQRDRDAENGLTPIFIIILCLLR